MDPFTIALATFGVQKLRGKSTRTALKDAALVGGTAYGVGALGGMQGANPQFASATQSLRGGPFSTLTNLFKSPTTNMIAADGTVVPMNTEEGLNQIAPKTTGQKIMGEPFAFKDGKPIEGSGSGLRGMYSKLGTAEKVGLGATGITLLGGEDEDPEPPFTDEDYEKAQAKADKQLSTGFQAADSPEQQDLDIYSYTGDTPYTFNQGGIATIVPKFNVGGINYLPSKTDHDENDYNNYIRAEGYVEDGSGNGDKDEDTMLAQLADGEFVSRADAILGAGIIEGANPKNYKDMRKKGAAFFYDQQAKFKRVFDMIDASRKDSKAS